nr:13917_t:CDS:2 [Entrophospora candida]CAG8627661.1 8088_t:CDS:2 [Entrophospora candida]
MQRFIISKFDKNLDVLNSVDNKNQEHEINKVENKNIGGSFLENQFDDSMGIDLKYKKNTQLPTQRKKAIKESERQKANNVYNISKTLFGSTADDKMFNSIETLERNLLHMKQIAEDTYIIKKPDKKLLECIIHTISSNKSPNNKESEKNADLLLQEMDGCHTVQEFIKFLGAKLFNSSILSNFSKNHVSNELYKQFPSNYSLLIKEAICKSHLKFNDPYLALSVFEQSKRCGIVSYIMGCNVDVYNELLRIRWKYWNDLVGIKRLLDEMKSNGIYDNEETNELINKIHSESSKISQLDNKLDYEYSRKIKKFESEKKFKKIYNM